MTNIIQELTFRGLIYQKTPGIEEIFQKKTTCYFGIDPTSDSLHIGNLVGLLTLKRISDAGHRVILLIGSGTALIGDPSGKEKERPILPITVIQNNKQKIEKQLKKIFTIDNKNVIITDNIKWLKNLKLINFLRDIGKLITLNSILDLEFIKKRLNSQEGISFAESTYQLLQGYDFLNLYQKYGCEIQIGGSDQLGNIVQGIELIRKKINKKAYGLTYPLLIDPKTGKKFGKTETGKTIWLDPQKTSAFEFYQFFLNIDDEIAPQIFRYFSFKSIDEIIDLESRWEKNKETRILQKALAEELTELLFGTKEKNNVLKLTEILFETRPDKLNFSHIPLLKKYLPYKKSQFNLEENLVDLKLVQSKNEAKKIIKQNGVKAYFIPNKFYLIKKGKKEFGLLELQ
jgi:tyrosyl-tRNA synthetase